MNNRLENIPLNSPRDIISRIAPTPSGYLHLGNALSFAITISIARKNNGKILLRIDDLDKPRIRKAFVEDIFETLNFLDIPWDLGPKNYNDYKEEFSQYQRLPLYQEALKSLVLSPALFACQCSRKDIRKLSRFGDYPGTCQNQEIDFFQKGVNWRMKTPLDQYIYLMNINRELVPYKIPVSLKDFAIRRKNELPTYQLASLVDDLHFGINLIVRGMDLLDSSIAQMYLSHKLPKNNFNQTLFYHHPLMKKGQGIKLSKSDGATSIQYLRKTGKTKKDIFRIMGEFMGFKRETNNLEEFQNQLLEKGL
ncbi:glutamate--tRNA ligase family protein [Echinicola jeungdonensis]|uniref:Glutamate--tRNA ligase family protein n=1 Tax=Echinicola jeungdonensis TaxID=709343 RepID=A0ABV5J2C3_9BACT|nr:glutamate--tRNA ligase family protein [Echinicola jeungdonensis]MDN3667800.1 glutamate--tRNA ligase family protein [Echinicola jeungdonensis]